jgi:hypothetical protein
MAVLDLRPPKLTIKFQIGKTFNPVFYYLGKDNAIVDLTGFDARMQVRLQNQSAVLTGWDLSIANGGLALVVGDAELDDGEVVQDAHGVRVNVSDAVTELIDWESALYDIELIDAAGTVLPFLAGDLQPSEEQTR